MANCTIVVTGTVGSGNMTVTSTSAPAQSFTTDSLDAASNFIRGILFQTLAIDSTQSPP
jgi:hypothetical protein